jgi:transposase-like protein
MMKCPICKSFNHSAIDLHVEGFYEELFECATCGSSWAVSHGLTEVVNDTQQESFLEALTECVESDDYCFAA